MLINIYILFIMKRLIKEQTWRKQRQKTETQNCYLLCQIWSNQNIVLLDCSSYHTRQNFKGETFVVLRLFTQLQMFSHESMAMSIDNISIQACYRKGFSWTTIFLSNRESFSPWKFCLVRSGINTEISHNGWVAGLGFNLIESFIYSLCYEYYTL